MTYELTPTEHIDLNVRSAFGMPGTDALALELERLAWMNKHFDDACKSATKFDGSYERAMEQFWANAADASPQGEE